MICHLDLQMTRRDQSLRQFKKHVFLEALSVQVLIQRSTVF
jgi:hypothetical protein